MNKQIQQAAFCDGVKSQLDNAGLKHAVLLSASPEPQPFGNVAVVFCLDAVLLRIVRDRGQVFLEVAIATTPTEFHQYDDVEIAMGWKTIAEVLGKREPEDLGVVLSRLHAHVAELNYACSGERAELTKVRFERAANERGREFTERLRGKRDRMNDGTP